MYNVYSIMFHTQLMFSVWLAYLPFSEYKKAHVIARRRSELVSLWSQIGRSSSWSTLTYKTFNITIKKPSVIVGRHCLCHSLFVFYIASWKCFIVNWLWWINKTFMNHQCLFFCGQAPWFVLCRKFHTIQIRLQVSFYITSWSLIAHSLSNLRQSQY